MATNLHIFGLSGFRLLLTFVLAQYGGECMMNIPWGNVGINVISDFGWSPSWVLLAIFRSQGIVRSRPERRIWLSGASRAVEVGFCSSTTLYRGTIRFRIRSVITQPCFAVAFRPQTPTLPFSSERHCRVNSLSSYSVGR
jgi:hypothetical protein